MLQIVLDQGMAVGGEVDGRHFQKFVSVKFNSNRAGLIQIGGQNLMLVLCNYWARILQQSFSGKFGQFYYDIPSVF